MSVGADIEAECGRCGKTWHVVIAMVDGRIAQVECGECHKRHRLRSGEGARPRPHRRTGLVDASARKPVAARPLVAADPDRPPRPYEANESYAPGDRVEHPAFGPGVVERLVGANKVQIFFAGGSRVLVHRRIG
ncbi:MAG: hypothetical protein OZ948_07190 [Deltaproteobacteria bacterium]|nr:hypothetical protein [Deltaproteobacteria bacterium]